MQQIEHKAPNKTGRQGHADLRIEHEKSKKTRAKTSTPKACHHQKRKQRQRRRRAVERKFWVDLAISSYKIEIAICSSIFKGKK